MKRGRDKLSAWLGGGDGEEEQEEEEEEPIVLLDRYAENPFQSNKFQPGEEHADNVDENEEEDVLGRVNEFLQAMVDDPDDAFDSQDEGDEEEGEGANDNVPPDDEEDEQRREYVDRNFDDFAAEQDTDDEGDGDGVRPMDTDEDNDEAVNYLDARFTLEKCIDEAAYVRPVAEPVDVKNSDFVFQHTETTYGLVDGKPQIRVWGVTERGNDVCMLVNNFRPYFYAKIATPDEADDIRRKLDVYLHTLYPGKRKGRVDNGRYVLDIERCEGRSICGWHQNRPMDVMYRFVMAHPAHVAQARNSLEFGNPAVVPRPYQTFEANVPFELRYMVDTKIDGCGWIKIKAGNYRVVEEYNKVSTSQYELYAVDESKIEPIPSSEKGELAPMRYLSYDIEVYNKGKGFPKATESPVILIACALNVTGSGKGIAHKVIFALKPRGGGTYKSKEGVTTYVFNTEKQLLLAFSQYVRACDPEGLTGWNTTNFDLPFLAERAKQLGIYERFMSFSRIQGKSVWIRQQTFQSKAYGAKVSNEMLCEGRFDYDGLTFMLRGQMEKHRSYTLNSIATKVTKEQKHDVHHSEIPKLFDGDDDDRTRLAHYCLQDALLPLRILDTLMAVINGIEQARVTGVPIKWLLARGQGVKTFSNLLRYKEPWEHTPSRTPKSNTEVTGGGYVRDPRRGFYKVPLASLDFASLYPSIMIAYNICFSTKVSLAWARAINPVTGLPNLDPKDYWVPWPSVDAKTVVAEEVAKVVEQVGDEKEKNTWAKIFANANFNQVPTAPKTKSKKEREREEAEDKVAGKEPDFCFVKRHVRQGVLPKMLETLLKTRANVKAMMKTEKDKMRLSVLDGRQLALKVVCNSVYGFLKAFILTDKDLMAAVTSYGRNMIRQCAELVETAFKDRDVVDVPMCRLLGIDPEVVNTPDTRPRTKSSAFVVYGDTDSIMINFGDITLAEIIAFGTEAAKLCTSKMEEPNSLAFESIKLRSLYLNKKRYASLEIEKYIPGERMADAIARAKVSIKGLEGKRRDNAPIGSDTQTEVLTILLKEGDVEKAERFVKRKIEDLLMDRVDMSDLVITKGLSKTEEAYKKGGSKQQHVELQKRMRKRSKFTGEAVPETGDRVPFIIKAGTAVRRGKKGASKAFELAEDPIFAQKYGVPINTDYYIHKQIWPAVIRVFTGVHEPEKCRIIKSNMSMPLRETLKAHKRLFGSDQDHMLARKIRKVRTFGMAEFTTVIPKCLGCGVRMPDNEVINPCCIDCNEEEKEKEKRALLEVLREKRDAAWDTCRKCQGGSFEKVTCSNLTCKNFFHRDRVIIDVEDLEKDMTRFDCKERVVAVRRPAKVFTKAKTDAAGTKKKKRGRGKKSAAPPSAQTLKAMWGEKK